MLVGKMLVGEQPGARLGSLGLLFSGGVVALGLQGGQEADRGLAVHAAGVIRTGMFWSLGDPQRKTTGVTIQVPHTPSATSRDVEGGSGFDVWRSLRSDAKAHNCEQHFAPESLQPRHARNGIYRCSVENPAISVAWPTDRFASPHQSRNDAPSSRHVR